MKNKCFSILLIGFVIFISAQNILAQDSPQWHLPEGAKARLGKGKISGGIAYSPDGTRLAVAGSIGIWIYDAQTGEELDLFTGHTDSVNSVAFSPDGTTLASGSGDGTLRLWDAHTRQHIRALSGHTDRVNSVVFSPDGRTLASGSGDYSDDDNTVRLWDVNTGRHKATLEHRAYVGGLVYSPNGDILVSITVDGLYLWDTGTSTLRKTLTLGQGAWEAAQSVAYSPDSRTIASVGDRLDLWNADTGIHIATLENYGYYYGSVTYSPDGRTLASTSYWSDTVRLWDAHTGRRIRTLTGRSIGKPSLAYSPDGLTLACSDYQGVHLWHVGPGKHNRMLTGHTGIGYSIAYSPDGTTLASVSDHGMVLLWDTTTGQYLKTLASDAEQLLSVVFSPDGTMLASCSANWYFPDEGIVWLWDVHTGRRLRTLTGHTDGVSSVSFSPDGQIIASGSWDNTIRLWDAQTGRHLRTLVGHTEGVSGVSFSPDGRILVSRSSDNTLRLWNVQTGGHLHTFVGHTEGVSGVSFSPDGRTLVSASRDDTVRLWDVATGKHLHILIGHIGDVNSVVFSPDGRILASASRDDTVRLWDVVTGKHLRTLIGHIGDVNSVVFSPDGATLASVSGWDDYTLRLWEVTTGKHIRTLNTRYVYSVAFSPDGRTLASGSGDGTVLLWELASAATSNATLSLSPASLQSPAVGERLTFSLKITDAENVAGYQATVSYDTSALRYVESANGDYLPSGAFFIPPVAEGDTVTLAASSLAGESSGDGTLATLTFEVVAVKASTVRLTNVLLTDSSGGSSVPQIENAEITEPPQLPEDVNKDGVVNIIDLTLVASNFGATGENAADVNGDGVVNIIDLTLVAAAFGNTASAPEIWSHHLDGTPTRAEVGQWLRQARQLNRTDRTFQRGITVLEQLLASLPPKETALLPNYPNPFNPETWIPYQLAAPAEVSISIYTPDGKLVRVLDLGHQAVGIYESRSRAAYWDGRNAFGEPIASGVYFYTLTAGDFSATRKMLIKK